MKNIRYLPVLLAVLMLACGILPALNPPTPTPAPTGTSTPVPTNTPLPTDTPTPVPTSTPNKTATADAKSTAAAQTVLGELDKLVGDTDIPYKDGRLAWDQDEPLTVMLTGPSWDYLMIDRKLTGEDFILKSDVTWDATGIIICSAMFRSEPDLVNGKQYEFAYLKFSGLSGWQIAVYNFGKFQNSPTKVQYSDAINQENGATNEVVLVAQGNQFNLYINGVHQGRYFDYSNQRMDGRFGFSANQDSGEGSCDFKNSWIWALESSD